jgi:intracellular septation protein
MKFLLDFLPLLLFFIAYKWFDIYVGTGVLMAATAMQMAIIYATERRLALQYKVTLVLVMAFGTLTLLLHDESFIKWKPTVLYASFSAGLALALWVWRKNVLRILLGSQISLPEPVWARLAQVWIAYNAFMATLNGYVVLNYTTEQWVNFKLWGYIFPLVFIVGQGIYIAPHMADPDANADADADGEVPAKDPVP